MSFGQRGKRCPRSSRTIFRPCRCKDEQDTDQQERPLRIYYVLVVICEGVVTLGVHERTLAATGRGHYSRVDVTAALLHFPAPAGVLETLQR